MGNFYWLRVKSSNHLHAELNLGYLKGTEFCLEIKASFVDISSIASFKPFLIAWLREYCTFSDSSVVNLKSLPCPKYTQLGTIFQKKIMFYYQTFFLLQICSLLDCSWQIPGKKNRGSTRSFKRKRRFYSVIELSLREISYVFHVHALMTRKSCAVGMRNAIPRNYLKWIANNQVVTE